MEELGDTDIDGLPELRLTFDGAAVQGALPDGLESVEATLSGELNGGASLEGSDLIGLVLAVERIWGDNDCDGEITSRDNQMLLRRILQQPPLSQTQPCPEVGEVLGVSGAGDKQWGDLDCDGEITSRDNQVLSRRILQQPPLSQTQPCPELGDAVAVSGVGDASMVASDAAKWAQERRTWGRWRLW